MHDRAYSLFLTLIVITVIWVVVASVFAVESNQWSRSWHHDFNNGNGHGKHSNNDSSTGWVVSGVICWFILAFALCVDAFICNVVSVHRMHVSMGDSKRKILTRKKAETNCAALMFILIFITTIWIVVLYSVMLSKCAEFGMCCEKLSGDGDDRGGKEGGGDGKGGHGSKGGKDGSCHSVRGEFWWQYILAIIGTIMAIVVGGFVVREPSREMAKDLAGKVEGDDELNDADPEMNSW